MIKLTLEQAQQIEEALDKARWSQSNTKYVHADYDKTMEALATIRAARAQAQEPVAANCPKCKSEISHWSWCPDFVQPVSQKQEPVAKFLEDNLVVENERVDKSGHRVLEIREEELLRIMEIYAANVQQAEHAPVVRNPTAAEVKAYRDKHCISMMAAKSALINEQALKNKTI